MSRAFCCLCLLLATALWAQPAVLSLGDFEDGKAWPGATCVTEPVKSGKQALLWQNLAQSPTLRVPVVPTDWTAYDRLCFWLYSDQANGQIITIVANSENPENGGDWDYYFHHLTIDWQGWRLISLRRDQELVSSRKPLGWNQIQFLSFNAGGWDHRPLPDTKLILDDVCLVRPAAQLQAAPPVPAGDGADVALTVTNTSDAGQTYDLQLQAAGKSTARLPQTRLTLDAGQAQTLSLHVPFTAGAAPLTTEQFDFRALPAALPLAVAVATFAVATPLPERPHPRLLLSQDEIERAKQRAAKYDWAKRQLEALIAAGNSALSLKIEDLPQKGGQWHHHYVCKTCGVALKTVDATHHQCPQCRQVYSGWPWDEVVVSNVHGRYNGAVRSLGLAYAFTGDQQYAQQARAILLAYADLYPKLAYHDVNGGKARSGGRLYAQTLDESVAIIGPAWGYDLVYDAPCFTAQDRAHIENDYLRKVCETIQRHDAGISNWQSWHNAGVAAVGFALNDPTLCGWALQGKSGLRFQLDNSVLPDGFWFEGTASYHFYALDALRYTVQIAEHAGIDFYPNAAYRSLYEGPVGYTFPNGQFPGINDGDLFSISGTHRYYEIAYAHWPEPAFAWVAGQGKRNSLEAFLWGVDELPAVSTPKLGSRNFQGLGAAVLRQGEGDKATYLHLDYGPHGGGHGHPDKLAVALYALGREIAPDPGRLAYGAALHNSWYRQTVAHNALVVDGKSQAPTTGKLDLLAGWPEAALAQASCDTAYPGVRLTRTVLLTDRYLLDLHSASSETKHTYDWVWHNQGEMTPGLPTTPQEGALGTANGYQHLKPVQTAATEADWTVDFKSPGGLARLLMLGAPGTQVYFTQGYTYNPPQPCPAVVVRREGNAALFTSLLSFGPALPATLKLAPLPVTINGRAAKPGEAWALQVTQDGREDIVMVSSVAGEKQVAGLTTKGKAFFAGREGGKVILVQQQD